MMSDVAPPLPAPAVGSRGARLIFWLGVIPVAALAVWIYARLIGVFLHDPTRHVDRLALFWAWSDFLHTGHAATGLYDPNRLFHFVRSRLRPDAHFLPFAYPPTLLLLIWPLAAVTSPWGLLGWLGIGLAALVWASRERSAPALSVFMAFAAPSTLVALWYGQVSLLVAGCLIGAWRILPRRPVLAGVLFGIAAVKPQFGLLVPVALIAAREWRCLIAATATVALSVATSGLVFGWTCWALLPGAMAGLSRFVAGFPEIARYDPTVTPALHLLGVPAVLAQAVQLAVIMPVAWAIWRVFRRGVTPLGVALLMAGTFLTTPYAVFYDLPLATAASVALIAALRTAGKRMGVNERAVTAAVVLLPVLLILNPYIVAWGVAVPAALFVSILRRIRTAPRSAPLHPAGSPPPPAPAAALASS